MKDNITFRLTPELREYLNSQTDKGESIDQAAKRLLTRLAVDNITPAPQISANELRQAIGKFNQGLQTVNENIISVMRFLEDSPLNKPHKPSHHKKGFG